MSVLVYVQPVCKNTDDTFEYDFFFSETPDFVWGPFWDVDNPSTNGNMTPDPTTYSEVYRVKTTLPIKTIEETTCYSIEYATVGILALAWIDIENLEDYPQFGRMTIYFGDDLKKISSKLLQYGWKLEKKCD